MFELETKVYEEHKAELLVNHNGEFVLIRGGEIFDTFKHQQDAIDAGYREWGNVPFFVKKIVSIEEPINFINPITLD